MASNDRWFLLVRDLNDGATDVKQFTQLEAAMKSYMTAERRYGRESANSHSRVEIVLIQGESLDRVKSSYPQYFIEGSPRERQRVAFRGLEALTAL